MRISEPMRPAFIAAALIGLAACDPATFGAPGAAGPTRASVNVAGQAITVAAPPGFCIDPESTAVDTGGAFLLLSDCRALGLAGAAGATRAIGASLTASISAGGIAGEGDDPGASLAELAAFLNTEDGRRVLGRSGRPGSIRLLSTQSRNGVLYALVEDRGPQPVAGIDRQFWRAFMEVKGRMAVLSVVGFQGGGVDAQDGLNYIASFATAIQAANPTPGRPRTAVVASEASG